MIEKISFKKYHLAYTNSKFIAPTFFLILIFIFIFDNEGIIASYCIQKDNYLEIYNQGAHPE